MIKQGKSVNNSKVNEPLVNQQMIQLMDQLKKFNRINTQDC